MALKSDNQGFLIGETVDIGKAVDQLRTIRNDVSAIKNGLLGTPNSGGKNTAIESSAKVATPSSSRSRDNKPATKAATPIRSNSGAGTPDIASAASKDTMTAKSLAKAASAATPNGRDASGRFTKKDKSKSGDDKNNSPNEEEKKSQKILSTIAGRVATTAIGATAGAEEVDPTIKAFQEVAEPMQRGYQMLFGGGDKDERWYKKIFKELNLFRKDETAFNKAQNKVLKNIEGKSYSSGEESPGFIGGLLGSISPWVMAAITGIGGALLTGIGTVLGAIFSPIGLAIGAAATVAWGLFTENGQKFFGEVGAKILAGWDKVVTEFAPITESISKGWSKVEGGFDSLINGMSSTWDAFTGFLKDKFGIDIPAILKPIVDVGKRAVDATKETVNTGADIAKETANKAVEVVKESSPKTTEALGNAWSKVQEGTGKIKAHATGKSAANKAAMIAEMDAQGITDPTERAMLMAQVDHESGNFAFTKELGNDAYFDKYDAGTKIGKRLGNTEKGDGARFKGRGLIQLTGRANYEAAGKDLGLDLINHPELAETPENAAKTALWFWKKNKLGDSARKGDVKTNRHGVNGGEKGLADVEQKFGQYLAEYKKPEPEPKTEQVPAVASITNDPTKGGIISISPSVRSFNSFVAGPGNANLTQSVFAAAPKVPAFTPAPTPAEAPPQVTPLASLDSGRSVTVTMPNADVGRDLSDRGIAHIVTGGLSSRG